MLGVAESEVGGAERLACRRGRVDQKRADALEMLAAMRETHGRLGVEPSEVQFRMDAFLG